MRNSALVMELLGGAVLVALLATGQEARQEWKLRRTASPDQVRLTIDRYRPGSSWSSTSDVPLSRFRGLTLGMLDHAGSIEFTYATDAARLVCRGRASFGSGAGTFTLEPNPDFVSELTRMGYDPPAAEQFFTLMMSRVSLDFARAVQDAGLHASTAQLIDLSYHQGMLDFIREVSRLGYRNLTVQDYIDLRNHGVTAEYLKGLKDAGYELGSEAVMQLRMHGVPVDFARRARNLGYTFTPDDLVQLRMHGVDGAYLQRLRDAGMRELTAEQISRLRQHGVD